MTIEENVAEEANKNLDNIVNVVQDTMENSFENNMGLSELGITLQGIVEDNQHNLDTAGYNAKQEVKNKNRWNEILNNLQPAQEESYSNIDQKTLDGYQARHDYFKQKYNNSDEFKNNCNQDIIAAITEFKDGDNGEQNYFNKIKTLINAQLVSYRDLFQYRKYTSKIKNEKFNDLNKIKAGINTYSQNLFIDSRKNNYEIKNYEFYKNIHFYLIILYYSLFVLFLIFSNFIQEQQYYNKIMVFYLILYLIFPIILPYILAYIKYLYVYYFELNNERDEIISYKDLADNASK